MGLASDIRAIWRPHYVRTTYGATNLCFTNVPSVTHRNQLQLALNAHLQNAHLQSLEFLTAQGQGLGPDRAIRGLMLLVQHLPLATEIDATKNIVENADKKWTLQDLTKILPKGATEWLLLTTVKEAGALQLQTRFATMLVLCGPM